MTARDTRGSVVRRTRGRVRTLTAARAAGSVAALALGLLLPLLTAPAGTALPAADPAGPASLRLVTLGGPGLAGLDRDRRAGARAWLTAAQDRTLAGLDAPEPVYRWLTALNGYAVRLTDDQAARLAARQRVVSVERDAVRPMAAVDGPVAPGSPSRASQGGAGVVIGVVDSGVDADSLVFADGTRLGRTPRSFRGPCAEGENLSPRACGDKLVGARWFVAGFGPGRLASSATMSARDDVGHGTAVASVAAGNAGVGVTARDRLGSYAGVAPQARVAAYKACWTAPDPDQDGCATSDLVTAVDRATSDRVDVLSLAVGGPSRIDTLDRALLGAAEADIVVVTAAGNDAESSYAAHAAPWAISVGAHTSPVRRGSLELPDGTTVTGAMATRSPVTARVVLGEDAAAEGVRRREAGLCRPGSLDAARTAGAMVVCARGAVSRLEKSSAVDRAGGVAMVLTNRRGSDLSLDVHRVPVIHLSADAGRMLRDTLRDGSGARAELEPAGVGATPPRPTGWSATGDPSGPLVSPTLLAPGVSVLGAVPPGPQSTGWRSFSGTSAAAAGVAGAAARVRAERPGWSADRVRSALATTALPVEGRSAVLDQGAGRVRPGMAARPGLVYDLEPGDLRRYLDGDLPATEANTASVLVRGGPTTVVRRVRNVGGRALYFSSEASGFTRHEVTVRPAALRLDPDEVADVTIDIGAARDGGSVDDGTVTWRGGDGSRVRIPVVISR